jgi:hypothetical protein
MNGGRLLGVMIGFLGVLVMMNRFWWNLGRLRQKNTYGFSNPWK